MHTKSAKSSENAGKIIWLCCLAYFVSYITRKNFGTAISGIIEQSSFTKAQLGMVETALLVTYGAGNVISGILGDKFRPQKIVFAGLMLASLCNIVFPLTDNVAAMSVIWAINGFAQALFWPPIVRIIAENLSSSRYRTACSHISAASQIATVGLYIAVPLVLETLGYKWMFYIAAAVGAVMSVVWYFTYDKAASECEKPAPDILNVDPSQSPEKSHFLKVLIGCGIITILTAIVFQGFLRDGITTWMPSFVVETGNMAASGAILMNVLMPVFGIAVTYLGTYIYSRFFNNELSASTVMFAAATLLLAALYICGSLAGPAIVSVIIAALAVGLMHCINLALISYVPARFAGYGAVSFLSGLTNAFTYIGSALSATVTAVISENFGWNQALILWLAVSFTATIVCALTIKRWSKFINGSSK